MDRKSDLKSLTSIFSSLVREDEIDFDSFQRNPRNSFILSKSISNFLSGDSFSSTFKPYTAIITENKIQVYSFYGFASLSQTKMYSMGKDFFKVGAVTSKGLKSVKVETDNGSYNLGLYLTVFDCQKVGQVIKTRDSIILDSVKGNDVRDLNFELMEYWSSVVGLKLTPMDYISNQCNEKVFLSWFKLLKEESRTNYSSLESQNFMNRFIEAAAKKKAA